MHIHIEEKSYGQAPILAGIELEIEPAQSIAILGPSGIGKSTLLRIIAGMDQNFKGQISARPTRISMVFQEPFLLNWRSALENLTLMTSCPQSKAKEALQAVGLEGMEHRLPQELSLGQQRRVSLARALVNAPELLILDEAFASLDDQTADQMRQIVQDFKSKNALSILMATHSQADLTLADHIYTLQNGNMTPSQ